MFEILVECDEGFGVLNTFIYNDLGEARRVARDSARVEGHATIYKGGTENGEIVAEFDREGEIDLCNTF